MKVLKLTQQQKELIEGNYGENAALFPVLDGNGNWILGKEVLNDVNFLSIKNLLDTLEEIDYVPTVSLNDI